MKVLIQYTDAFRENCARGVAIERIHDGVWYKVLNRALCCVLQRQMMSYTGEIQESGEELERLARSIQRTVDGARFLDDGIELETDLSEAEFRRRFFDEVRLDWTSSGDRVRGLAAKGEWKGTDPEGTAQSLEAYGERGARLVEWVARCTYFHTTP